MSICHQFLRWTAFFFAILTAVCWSEELDNSDRNLKIAIIGAGPSGITAAAALKEKGYQNVTIFETNSEVGGKVKTVLHNGLPYEMGAVVIAPDYKLILKIIKELQIPLVTTPKSAEITPDGEVKDQDGYVIEKYGRFELLASTIRFSKFTYKNRPFFEPGFAHTPPTLFTTYEEFAQKQDVEAISEAFRPVMVGCGYGFAEDMPAAYWTKLMKTFVYERAKNLINPFGPPFFRAFPHGWQDLWKQWAQKKKLQVLLNTEVTDLERTNTPDGNPLIVIRSGNQTYLFDRVIITIPHLAKQFLDQDRQEAEIFSMIRTIPYKVSLVEIDGLPKNIHLFVRAHSTKLDYNQNPNDGKIVLISNNQNNNVYQIYQFSKDKDSETLRDIMLENIKGMKGTVKKIVTEAMYDYFPHFEAKAFIEGIPQKLSNLQGNKGTYYTGALMNFETVELAAEHGDWLVQQYF